MRTVRVMSCGDERLVVLHWLMELPGQARLVSGHMSSIKGAGVTVDTSAPFVQSSSRVVCGVHVLLVTVWKV